MPALYDGWNSGSLTTVRVYREEGSLWSDSMLGKLRTVTSVEVFFYIMLDGVNVLKMK